MPFALRPGTMITGYEIVRAIGAGGFGITYEGFNPITERRVAIKEFFPRGIASRDDATRIAYSKQDNDIVTWALKRFAEYRELGASPVLQAYRRSFAFYTERRLLVSIMFYASAAMVINESFGRTVLPTHPYVEPHPQAA